MDSVGRLRGLAWARRSRGLVNRHGEALSVALEHELFRHAEIFSEGEAHGGRARVFFGSTMITVDLEGLAKVWRGRFDADARARLVRAVEGSVRVRVRVMRIARADVERRLSGESIGKMIFESRVRADETRLYLDVDVEAPVGVSSVRRRR